MEKLIKEIKSFTKFRYVIPMLILALALHFVSILYMPMLSVFAAAMVLALIGIVLFDYTDDKVNGAVNTYEEIVNNRNIAYALYLFSYAFIIGCALISATVAFFSLAK